MTDLESNVQAYRVMAEILVGLRRIVQRGLHKQAGESWPTEVCPPQVYERLRERKETELSIERLSLEHEELMSFATFADLAEMIQANAELATLLRNLAPSAEALCARLSDLEALRVKLARAIPLNPDELSVLTKYSAHLRKTLAGARRKAQRRRSGGAPVENLEEAEEVEEVEETADLRQSEQRVVASVEAAAMPGGEADLEEPEELPAPLGIEEEPRLEEPEAEPAPEETAAATDEEPAATGPEEVPAEPQPAVTAVAAPSTAMAGDPDALAEDVQKAMVDEDDREVLRLLRREIIAAAEAMYRARDEVSVRGWAEVRRDGWFERRKEELALAPLEEFHDIVDEYLARGRSGDMTPEQVRELLADRRFPRLLLALREVFLRNRV